MEIVQSLRDLSKDDIAIAGGKGANLGELMKKRFTVPDGFVILATAFEEFLRQNAIDAEIDAQLERTDVKKTHMIENASETIQSLILNAEIPQDIVRAIEAAFDALDAKQVAVRSSATMEDGVSAAWAGQLETFLETTKKTLIPHVKKCWASPFSPRALSYRLTMHAKNGSVAVVVQKMVPADYAGVSFSVHPVTQDENQILIEAVSGLGESLVSGSVTPDTYILHKKTTDIIERSVAGKRQLMSDPEIESIAKEIISIEQHFGYPVDVEWARAGGKTYFLQARPITTLNSTKNDSPYDQNRHWVHHLARPVSLFGASLWDLWRRTTVAEDIIGVNLPDALFIEQVKGVPRRYRVKEQLKESRDVIADMIANHPEKTVDALKRGLMLSKEAEKAFAKDLRFANIRDAIDFFVETSFFTTSLPDNVLTCIEQYGLKAPEIVALAEKLRVVTWYPRIINDIIYPIAVREIEQHGFAPEDVELLLISELLKGNFAPLRERVENRTKGKLFVYQNLNGAETVQWFDDTKNFISALEQHHMHSTNVSGVSFHRDVDWQIFHTRPFSLLGATLWHGWYGSELMRKLYKTNIQHALFFEEHRHVVRFYWDMSERKAFLENMEALVRDDVVQYESLLRKAFILNDEAESCIRTGKYGDGTLEDLMKFLFEVPIHATTLPNISFPLLAEIRPDRHDLHELCEKLRSVSYYPKITKQLFIPLAIERLAELGVNNASEKVHSITLQELLDGDISQIDRRKSEENAGKHFIYQSFDGKASDWWIEPGEMHQLVLEMEGVANTGESSVVQLKGNIAYQGLVRGKARVVLGSGEGEEFDEGDILVTICSSPTMMPLIQKCSAIVTDEGGISCHAAVISRELKKPCVMSTKLATTLIKTGDHIEVNALKGMVTVLGARSSGNRFTPPRSA